MGTQEGGNAPVANMLGQAAILRLLTNQTPGQFSVDQAVHNLDPEALAAAAKMSQGLLPTAAQVMSDTTIRRGQDMGAAASAASNALGWGELAARGAIAELDARVRLELGRMSSGTGSTVTLADAPELFGVYTRSLEALGQAQTPAERQSWTSAAQGIGQLLTGMGFQMPAMNPSTDQGQFAPIPGVGGILPWNWPGVGAPARTTLPMQVSPQQIQQWTTGAYNLMNPQPFRFGSP
jgi:hypothetical protein